ncbi:MAG: tetratricopeptide repeat protein, partial [Bacteroidia bacterium]
MQISKKSFPVFLLIILLISFFNFFCNSSFEKKETFQNNTYLNHGDSVKYMGIETCRSCHLTIYNSFIQTGMGQSFNVASRKKSAADFSEHSVVFDKYSNMNYHPFFIGDSMYIMEFRLEKKDTVYKRIEKVDYIVGSGQHTNSHMMNVNGYLYQLPLTWYAQQKKWDLPPGFENGANSHFNRAIGFECMSCHNAMPEFVSNSLNKFTKIPRGIDCERCHGPGEIHVKEKLAGKIIDTSKQIDYTIVNPRRLGRDRQIDVCQRCHLQGNTILKNGKIFSDFRPGMNLSDFMEVYMPVYKGREDEFIMASHSQRLQMSKCYLKTESVTQPQTTNLPAQQALERQAGDKRSIHRSFSAVGQTLSCITCHNPHISVKVTGKQVFNNACSGCHEIKNSCTEKMENRKSVNDNCVGCHMPKSGAIDIPHITITDHRIQIPARKPEIKRIKEFAGIYCVNNKASDVQTKADAYLNYYEKFTGEKISLDSANYFLSFKGQNINIHSLIHYLFLKKQYGEIIFNIKNVSVQQVDDPMTCYRIGQAYQNLQQNSLAEIWYRKAVAIAGDNLDYLNKLATFLVSENKTDEAIAGFENSLSKNKKQVEALTNLGFAFLKQNKTDE